jgi:hypothetical protein
MQAKRELSNEAVTPEADYLNSRPPPVKHPRIVRKTTAHDITAQNVGRPILAAAALSGGASDPITYIQD